MIPLLRKLFICMTKTKSRKEYQSNIYQIKKFTSKQFQIKNSKDAKH